MCSRTDGRLVWAAMQLYLTFVEFVTICHCYICRPNLTADLSILIIV